MDALKLIQPVTVKAVVTEQLKRRLSADAHSALEKIQRSLQQLEFESKRILTDLEHKQPDQLPRVRQQLAGEKGKRQQQRQQLIDRLKQIENLEFDTEIDWGKSERLVEVAVGDRWMGGGSVEIVIKDDKVVDIRERR